MSPVVNKEEYPLYDPIALERGYNHKRGYYKITKYTSKYEQFTIDLPDYIAEVLGRKAVRGESQKIVNEEFQKAIREYNIRTATKKKVLAYALLANVKTEIDGEPFTRDNLGYYRDLQDSIVGLALWWKVCWETTAGESGLSRWKKGLVYYDLDGKEVSKPRFDEPIHTMNYTPEREAFFKDFERQMGLMVYNADQFVNQNQDLFLEMISLHKSLPFLPKEEEGTT